MNRPKRVTHKDPLIHIRLAAESHRLLKTLAVQTGTSIQDAVSGAIEQHLIPYLRQQSQWRQN